MILCDDTTFTFSESLAGRIAYVELPPLTLKEVGPAFSSDDLWFRGGFPDALLMNAPWKDWMNNFVRTYLERDLPNLGFPGNPVKAGRLWTMLAHIHGNPVNYSDLARSLDLSAVTVKTYIDFLEQAFLLRQLKPYIPNLKKRVVRSPKVYLRDSGILHFLLGIASRGELLSHPRLGASWEGFVIDKIAAQTGISENIYYYRTHDGSEVDLVLEKGGRAHVAVEVKFGADVRPGKGNLLAVNSLGTANNFIVSQHGDDYLSSNGFRTCNLERFLEVYLPELGYGE